MLVVAVAVPLLLTLAASMHVLALVPIPALVPVPALVPTPVLVSFSVPTHTHTDA